MTTTATHLSTIALHWTDLREAAGQPTTIGAFGLGLRGYLARLVQADAEQLKYERHQAAHLRSLERDPIQLGDRPAPVRLHILDTMRAIESALVACADDIAHAAQRAPVAGPTAAAPRPTRTSPSAHPAAGRHRRRRPGPPRVAGARGPRRPEALTVHRAPVRAVRRAVAAGPDRTGARTAGS